MMTAPFWRAPQSPSSWLDATRQFLGELDRIEHAAGDFIGFVERGQPELLTDARENRGEIVRLARKLRAAVGVQHATIERIAAAGRGVRL